MKDVDTSTWRVYSKSEVSNIIPNLQQLLKTAQIEFYVFWKYWKSARLLSSSLLLLLSGLGGLRRLALVCRGTAAAGPRTAVQQGLLPL